MEKNKAYLIKHHDEGLCTENHQYISEGYRIHKVVTTIAEQSKFKDSQHSSGFSEAVVLQSDIQRFLNNYNITMSAVISVPQELLTENLLGKLRESDVISKVEILKDNKIECRDLIK